MARRRSAVVPRAVLKAGFAGVVPACVIAGLQACSSGPVLGVAAVAYCCFEAGLPDGDASDAKDSSDAPSDVSSDAVGDVVNDAPTDGPKE